MSKLRENKPTADVLMVSMRAMGYSFESAVADVIDNSTSAHANSISVKFPVRRNAMWQFVITVTE